MLEASLKEAQLKRQKRLFKAAIAVLVIVIVASAILILGTNCCSFGDKEAAEIKDILPGEQQVSDAIEKIESTEPSKQPDLLARESYLQKLNQYQTEIEPALSNIALETWQPDKAAELLQSKDNALTAFTESKYGKAKQFIEQTIILGQQLIEQAELEFNQALNSAIEHYTADQHQLADEQIQQALMLNSQSKEALALAANIEKLGKLMPLIEQAKVAEKENNLDKELEIVKQILELAPDREQAKKRRTELTEKINQRQFSRYIKQAYADIDNENAFTVAEARDIWNKSFDVGILFGVTYQLKRFLVGVRYTHGLPNQVDKSYRDEKGAPITKDIAIHNQAIHVSLGFLIISKPNSFKK